MWVAKQVKRIQPPIVDNLSLLFGTQSTVSGRIGATLNGRDKRHYEAYSCNVYAAFVTDRVAIFKCNETHMVIFKLVSLACCLYVGYVFVINQVLQGYPLSTPCVYVCTETPSYFVPKYGVSVCKYFCDESTSFVSQAIV